MVGTSSRTGGRRRPALSTHARLSLVALGALPIIGLMLGVDWSDQAGSGPVEMYGPMEQQPYMETLPAAQGVPLYVPQQQAGFGGVAGSLQEPLPEIVSKTVVGPAGGLTNGLGSTRLQAAIDGIDKRMLKVRETFNELREAGADCHHIRDIQKEVSCYHCAVCCVVACR